MIGQRVTFTANALQDLPHIEDKHYRILDVGFVKWLSKTTYEFVHDMEYITHVFLEDLGMIHADHLNLPQ